MRRVAWEEIKEIGNGVREVDGRVAEDHQSLGVTAVDILEEATTPTKVGAQTEDHNAQRGHRNKKSHVGQEPRGICGVVEPIAVHPETVARAGVTLAHAVIAVSCTKEAARGCSASPLDHHKLGSPLGMVRLLSDI